MSYFPTDFWLLLNYIEKSIIMIKTEKNVYNSVIFITLSYTYSSIFMEIKQFGSLLKRIPPMLLSLCLFVQLHYIAL